MGEGEEEGKEREEGRIEIPAADFFEQERKMERKEK